MQVKHHHLLVALAVIILFSAAAYINGIAHPGETATGSWLYTNSNSDGQIKVVFSATEPNVNVHWAYYQFTNTSNSGVAAIASTAVAGQQNQYEANFTVERGNDIFYMIGDSGSVRQSAAADQYPF